MNPSWKTTHFVLCVLVFAFLFSGCAIVPKNELAGSSTSYNIVVEKAQNEMLLLNILRASMRRPMYFTDFSALRGNMSYSFQTGGVTMPFGGYNGAYSVAPSIGYTTNPNFDLVVWNDQEFTRGIMTPVSAETFYYYLMQGWPSEMLYLLFIERMEHNGKTISKNNPEFDEPNELEALELKTKEWLKNNCSLREIGAPVFIGPEISAEKLDIKQIINVQKTSGLSLKPQGCDPKIPNDCNNAKSYRLVSSRTSYEFVCRSDEGHETVFTTDGTSKGVLLLRSPEAILYYLGEIVRAEMKGESTPRIYGCPLFVVKKSEGGAATVSVEYEGDKYIIPRHVPTEDCQEDRSMHVLSLVSQLIGLHKKADKAPVTGVVTVIGQ